MENKKKGKIILTSACALLVLAIMVVTFIASDMAFKMSYALEDEIILSIVNKKMTNTDGVKQNSVIPIKINPTNTDKRATYNYTIWLEKEGNFNNNIFLYLNNNSTNEVGKYYGNVKCYDYLNNTYLNNMYSSNDVPVNLICGSNFNEGVASNIYGDVVELYQYSSKEYGDNSGELICNYTEYVWNSDFNKYIKSTNESIIVDNTNCQYGIIYGVPVIVDYHSLNPIDDKVKLLEGSIIYENGMDIDGLGGVRSYNLRYWLANDVADEGIGNYRIRVEINKEN